MPEPLLALIFLPFGLLLGMLGSFTGIGGGFLLMPFLLVFEPGKDLPTIAVMTMSVVFLNALAGSVRAVIQRTIHYRTGGLYILVSLPAVWLGNWVQGQVSRQSFSLAFGGFLVLGAVLLFFKRTASGTDEPLTVSVRRYFLGCCLSLIIGFLSSFFGVGGGFLYVPLLVFLLGYRVAEATATSQFIIGAAALLSLASNWSHIGTNLDPWLLAALATGVIVGSPLGGWLSEKLPPQRVMRVLAGLLALVAVKMIIGS